jgi:uroporphyrinogen-III synthase
MDPVNQQVLRDVRVLLTRPATAADRWREALVAAGAEVVAFPTIEVGPPPDSALPALDRALAHLHDYDWLIFTSAHAATFTCARLPPALPRASLSRPRIAAVGDETARAIAAAGLPVALVPRDQRQEGLVDALGAAGLVAGARVLFARARAGRDHLVDALAGRGVEVDLVIASETRARRPLPLPPPFDVATFASPSALDAYVAALGTGTLLPATCVVIGATTAAAARAHGIDPCVARAPNPEAVIEAIAIALAARSNS